MSNPYLLRFDKRSVTTADWAHPDFSDTRFAVEHVQAVDVCRHVGCERLAEYVVAYSMKREGWTYDYECGYCRTHLPPKAQAALGRPRRACLD